MKSPTRQVHPGFKALATTIAIATLALSATPSRAADNTTTGTGALPGTTTGTGNTADGYQALGKDTQGSANTAVGAYSLWSNTTGINNTAAGFQSLYNNQSGAYNTAYGTNSLVSNLRDFNTAVGCNALYANTDGSFNTATGYAALIRNTAGSYNSAYGANALANNQGANNTAIGFSALAANVGGSFNSAFGSNSLLANFGNSNTALGYAALNKNTWGTNNTAVGFQTLTLNIVGGFNVAIGDGALQNSTGSGNIAIGEDAGFNLTTGNNNIYLGNRSSDLGGTAISTESGKIRIGTKATHTDTYIAGVIHGDGSGLTGVPVTAASLTLPLAFSKTTASGSAVFSGTNTTGNGVSGASSTGNGLYGQAGAGGNGVYGNNPNGTGVAGTSSSGFAMFAHSNTSYGIYAASNTQDGVHGVSTSGCGVYGIGTYGVHGVSNIQNGIGVLGETIALPTAAAYGVMGIADNLGLPGTPNTGGIGVYGRGSLWAGNFEGNLRVTGDETLNGKQYYGNTTRQMLNLWGTQYGIGVQANNEYFRTAGSFAWYNGGAHNDNWLSPGANAGVNGTTLMWLDGVGNLNVTKDASVRTLTIRGGADLAEPFLMSGQEMPKGAVVVIDDEHAGQLKMSGQAYDHHVAGIVSGANGINPGIALHQEGMLEGGQNVALSGRVYVQADASNGVIKPGDLLTTSDLPGRAMKATDHERAQGAIIGKAMSSLDEGTGMVLVLVTLQ